MTMKTNWKSWALAASLSGAGTLLLAPATAEAASCEGLCGGPALDCWCDDLCEQYGDCCVDYEPYCIEPLENYWVTATSHGEADEVGLAVTRYGTRTVSIDPASPQWSADDVRLHDVEGGRTVIYTSAVRWHHDAALANLQARASAGEDVQGQLDGLSPNLDWLRVTGPLGEEIRVTYDVAATRWQLGRHGSSLDSASVDPPSQGQWHELAVAVDFSDNGLFRLRLYVDGELMISRTSGQDWSDLIMQEAITLGRGGGGQSSALETGPLLVIESETAGIAPLSTLWATNALVPEPGLLGSWPLLDCFYGNFGEVPTETEVDTTAFPSCTLEAGVGLCGDPWSLESCQYDLGEPKRIDRIFGPGMGVYVSDDAGLEPKEAITFGGRVQRAWSIPTDGPEWIIANLSQGGGYDLFLDGTSATARVTLEGYVHLAATADLAGLGDDNAYSRTLTASYDAETGRLRLMVDGRVMASDQGPVGGLMMGSTMPLGIGHYFSMPEHSHLNASLSDVRIYDHVISSQTLARWSYRWHGDLEAGHRTWARHTEVDDGAWIVDYDQSTDIMNWSGAALSLDANSTQWKNQRGVNMLAPPRFELDTSHGMNYPTRIAVEFRQGWDANADGSMGLIYGYQDDDNYYRLSAGAKGVELTVVKDGSRRKAIERPDLSWVVSARPFSYWHTLEVEHVDFPGPRQHRITVDGEELVYEEPFPAHDGGQVGLFAEALEDVDFRNLQVMGGEVPEPYDGLTTYVEADKPSPAPGELAWPAWSSLTTPTVTPTGVFIDNDDPPYLLMDAICKSEPENMLACMGGGIDGMIAVFGGEAVMAFYVLAAILPRSLYAPPAAGDAYLVYFDATRDGHPVWCAEWAINSNVQIHTWCWEDKEAWWLDGGPSWEPYGGI